MGFILLIVVIATRLVRPIQRFVILLGAIAGFAQVCFPPCAEIPGPVGTPQMSLGRRLLVVGDLSYHPTNTQPFIDGSAQATGLFATVGSVIVICSLIEWRLRISESKRSSQSL